MNYAAWSGVSLRRGESLRRSSGGRSPNIGPGTRMGKHEDVKQLARAEGHRRSRRKASARYYSSRVGWDLARRDAPSPRLPVRER